MRRAQFLLVCMLLATPQTRTVRADCMYGRLDWLLDLHDMLLRGLVCLSNVHSSVQVEFVTLLQQLALYFHVLRGDDQLLDKPHRQFSWCKFAFSCNHSQTEDEFVN